MTEFRNDELSQIEDSIDASLKPYVIYSRSSGRHEGAALVFAHNIQEAKRLGWRGIGHDLTDTYIDLGCNLLRNCDWLFEEAKYDFAHVIDDPVSCIYCGMWGQSPIGADDSLCEDCRDMLKIKPEEIEMVIRRMNNIKFTAEDNR